MNIIEYENYHEQKTHGELIFPYNTYLCSIPLDFRAVPTHWHDEMELVYIKKGKGIITVDFRSHTVSAPSLVLILPGQLHAIEQYESSAMEYENIIFHPGMLLPKNADSTSADFLQPLIHGQLNIPTVFSPEDPYYKDLSEPIDKCDEICKERPRGYELFIKSMLFRFLFVLDTCFFGEDAAPKNRRSFEKMKLILKYVENHYAQKITVRDAADLLGFSESHFMRYFKEMMNTSFIDYLKDYRLAAAAQLLQSSESSILEVAEAVGFENLSYFNRSFKTRYGMTPTQFRKN